MSTAYNSAVAETYQAKRTEMNDLHTVLIAAIASGKASGAVHKEALKNAGMLILEAVNILEEELHSNNLDTSTKQIVLDAIRSAENIISVTITAASISGITL